MIIRREPIARQVCQHLTDASHGHVEHLCESPVISLTYVDYTSISLFRQRKNWIAPPRSDSKLSQLHGKGFQIPEILDIARLMVI